MADRKFNEHDFVRKTSGSWWEGRVVGFYSTEQSPDGVAVQLDRPMGPVQIYPASALELTPRPPAMLSDLDIQLAFEQWRASAEFSPAAVTAFYAGFRAAGPSRLTEKGPSPAGGQPRDAAPLGVIRSTASEARTENLREGFGSAAPVDESGNSSGFALSEVG
jgi:hypothetical protein